MKKVLILIAALLVFSVLCTSVSAPLGYYMASFYGEAGGYCWVSTVPPGSADGDMYQGKGSVHIRGSAIVTRNDTDIYLAGRDINPNTRLWTRRTRMTVSWGSEKLMVYMWPSDVVMGMFFDDEDWFYIANMSFFGYYKGESGLQFIRGNAAVMFAKIGPSESSFLGAVVVLYIGTEHFRSFIWIGEEILGISPRYIARDFSHGVAVWPIPWHPSVPF